MDTFFNDFFSYERILLLLGVALFLVLLTGLILFIVRKQPIKLYYLLSFLIPVVMIAFPSIQRVTFLNDFVSFEKMVEEVADNPEDEEARKDLRQALQGVEQRPVSDPEKLIGIAKAYLYLGDYDRAGKYIDKTLELQPGHEEAQRVQHFIQLSQAQEELQEDPDNPAIREKVERNVRLLEDEPKMSKAETKVLEKGKKLLPGKDSLRIDTLPPQ